MWWEVMRGTSDISTKIYQGMQLELPHEIETFPKVTK